MSPAIYVVDALAAIELARRNHTPQGDVELFAPTLLRSQVFSLLLFAADDHPANQRTELELAEAACRLPRRLLGDVVLRRTAWRLANEHAWSDTYDAEYIALTLLHGRALVAESQTLLDKASPLVRTESVDSYLSIAAKKM